MQPAFQNSADFRIERMVYLEHDVLVGRRVDDGVEVAERHEAEQLHRLRRTPLAGRAVRQRDVQLE